MYKTEISLKATKNLIDLIKSDYGKRTEFKEKAYQFLKNLYPDLTITSTVILVSGVYFFVEFEGEKTFEEVKQLLEKYKELAIKSVEHIDDKTSVYVYVSQRTQKGKEITKEWQEKFKEYEKPIVRYEDFLYIPLECKRDIKIVQVDEETLLLFTGNEKVAEKLIETEDWERVYIKTTKNSPNYAKEFIKQLKEKLKED